MNGTKLAKAVNNVLAHKIMYSDGLYGYDQVCCFAIGDEVKVVIYDKKIIIGYYSFTRTSEITLEDILADYVLEEGVIDGIVNDIITKIKERKRIA